MKLSKILAYIFAAIALIFEGFFGIISFVSFILQVILVVSGIFLLTYIFRRSKVGNYQQVILRYILTMLGIIGFFISIMFAFIQYQHIMPGIVSDITLTHSGQHIVFVEMSHIASPEFFAHKKETIQLLARQGYTILYEGVKPGTPDNQAIFDRAMGFDFTPTLYSTIANLVGLHSQDNGSLFAEIATGSLISVDLSIDDIVRLMDTGSQVIFSSGSVSGSFSDAETEIGSAFVTLSPRERIWMSWVGRGLLSWSLRRSDDLSDLLTTGSQAQLFNTIINRRNDAIIRYIQDHPTERIAIVYGALHFNGVYEALQRLSPAWQVAHIENSEPYTIR
ncbi:hypothetical protein H7170_03045 [Candidatus Gracilibacteria bacterium]|nr:hypothetical protein [Candidatus Gracilibacteria bacterium]